MWTKFIYSPYVTRALWVTAALVFIMAEVLVVVSYFHPVGPHTPGLKHLLMNILIVSVPGLGALKGYSVARRLSPVTSQDNGRFIWLARQFLIIGIAAYVAIGWRF